MRAVQYRTTAWRSCLALVAGLAIGVALVGATVAAEAESGELSARARGKYLLFPVDLQVWVAVPTAAMFALFVAALSVPLWFGLGKLGLNGWRSAAVAGFSTTLLVWTADALVDGDGSLAIVTSGLQWAAIGAVAVLATWRIAYRKAPPAA